MSDEAAAAEWPGRRWGLPARGAGSLAPTGPRLAALLIDSVLSALVAGLFTAPALPRNWSLVAFVASGFLFVAVFGQTPGQRLLGLRVVRTDGPGRVGWWRAAARVVGVALLVPAAFRDGDGRGAQDRLTDTAVVRA